MVRKILFASALVALGLALPAGVSAQDMGGGSDGKKDDAPATPDAPKPDAPKPDAPKPDAPKPEAKKTLAFDTAPSSWKQGRMGPGGGGGGAAGRGEDAGEEEG